MAKEGSSDYKKVRKRWVTFDWMVLCGTKNGSSMASLWRTFWSTLIFKSVFHSHKVRYSSVFDLPKQEDLFMLVWVFASYLQMEWPESTFLKKLSSCNQPPEMLCQTKPPIHTSHTHFTWLVQNTLTHTLHEHYFIFLLFHVNSLPCG